jgi:hypothetical protein
MTDKLSEPSILISILLEKFSYDVRHHRYKDFKFATKG